MRIILLALLIGLSSCVENKDDVKTTLEDVNIGELSKDQVLMKTLFDCLMDQKPCGEMQYLRDSIPGLIASKCGDCSDKQKAKFGEVNTVMQNKYPEEYKSLIQKYSVN